MANIDGTTGNDVLNNAAGSQTVTGGNGNDTLVYQGVAADFQIQKNAAGVIQTRDLQRSVAGDEGVDTLLSVEQLQFADRTWRLSGESRVNSTTQNFQIASSVTPLLDGGYLMAWQSNLQDGSGLGIFAQRFDAQGRAVGAEFQINRYNRDDQSAVALSTLSDGRVVALWQSLRQDGSESGIYAQQISASGELLGEEFLVNSTTALDQLRPSVTALSDGGFLTTWESNAQDGAGYGIYAQRFDAAGGRVGTEFLVNSTTAQDQTRPSVTALSDGGYVLVWQSNRQDGSGLGVYAQRYDQHNQVVGSEFLVNTTTANHQQLAHVTALLDGGFVVTWQSNLQDGSGYGIYTQRFDAAGARVGVETAVNLTTLDEQRMPKVLALSSGGYVVVWQSTGQDGSGSGIYGRMFDAQGAAISTEFQVNSTTIDEQTSPNLAALANGGFVVTWSSNGQDGSGYGIYSQRFNAQGQPLVDRLIGSNQDDILRLADTVGTLEVEGGLGNDIYIIENNDVKITERAGEGSDTVISRVSHQLGEHVEHLKFTGIDHIDGTGNALNNRITGNNGVNVLTGLAGDDVLFGLNGDDQLYGGAGNDLLDGGSGGDLMVGGTGDDVYYRNNNRDVIVELADEGIDTVHSTIHYNLGDNLENLVLTGTYASVGRGNQLDNSITGNDQNNILDGRLGNDILLGGKGADTYIMARGYQSDRIVEADPTLNTHDVLSFTGTISQEQLWFSRQGNHLVVSIIGTTDQISIQNWYSGKQHRVEIFSSGNGRYLSHVDVQNLVNAMAVLTPPPLGQLSLTAEYQALLGVINQNWSTTYPDTTAPAAPMVSLAQDTGRSATDLISSNATLAVNAEAGALIEYSADGINWSGKAPMAVEGRNTVWVRQTDRFDNVSEAQRFEFVLDTTAPLAPSISLVQDSGRINTDRITAQATISLGGLASDALVEYSSDGVMWSTTAPKVVEGSNTVWVRQVDVAGNASPASQLSFVLDTQVAALAVSLASDSGASATDAITNSAVLNVTGQEANARVEYSTDGGASWRDVAPVAVEGSNRILVRQTDVAGNVSTPTLIEFVLDTTAPLAPSISLAQDTGSDSMDLITAIAALSLSGVEADALVEYSGDGVMWSTTAPMATEGSNTVWVRQTDVAGNVSPASQLSFSLDTQVAALAVSLASDSGASATDAITNSAVLNVTGQEANARVEYSTDGGASWRDVAPVAVEGSNRILVRQTDVAGNVSTPTLIEFVLDTTAPLAPSISLAQDTGSDSMDLITAIAALSLSGVEADALVEYSSDGVMWSTTAPMATEGSNTVWVRQTDVAGNVSPASQLSFSLDTQVASPTVALSNDTGMSGTDLISRIADLTVTGEDGALIEYSTNGTVWSKAAPTAVEGSNSVWVRQTDAAGNTSAATRFSFVLDTQVAALDVTLQDSGRFDDDALTNNSILLLANTEDGALVEYSSDGMSWSNTAPTPVQGANTFWVRQVDVAGNVSTATSVSFVFDSIAPNQPRLELDDDTGLSALDNVSSNGTLLIRGLASDVELEYSIDGINWDASTPIPVEGENSIWVRQVDRAGNPSAPQTIVFILDTTSPVAPTITLSQDSGNSATDLLTNMAALSLAGVEEGAWVEYSTDGGESWSDVAPAAVEGSNSIRVRQTDLAGNVSTDTEINFILDTQIADLSIALDQDTGRSDSDYITSSSSYSIGGAEDGALVEYSIDGTTWSTAAPTAVEGNNTIYVRQTDGAGNVAATQTLSFTLDTQIATVGIALSQDTGSSDTDLITSIGAISLSDVEDGALVEYSSDGMLWSTTAPTVVEGSNTIWVRQTDVAGNVATPSQLSFVIDTQISTPILSLDNDSGVSNTDLITNVGQYSTNGIETDALVEYSSDGMSWSSTAPTAVEGLNTIYVRQTDTAGNVAATQMLSFTLDTQIATVGIALSQDTGSSDTDLITSVGTISLSDVEDGALVEYSTDDGMTWSDVAPSILEGLNTIVVRQTDVAGNVSPESTISFTLDTQISTPILSLDNDSGVSNTDLITNVGQYSTNGIETDALVEYSSDGMSWSSTAPTAVEGLNTIYVRQTDVAGNTASSSLTFTIDTRVVAPTVALAQDTGRFSHDRITNVSTLSVTGTEIGALIEYSSNGTAWSTTQPTATQGLNTVHVRQTDVAGNVSATTTVSFTFDNIAPAQPRIQLDDDTGISSTDLISSNGALLIRGLVADAQLQYSLDGQNWSSNTITPVEGVNTLFVRQLDRAGNASAGQSITFTLDTRAAAPVVTLVNDSGLSNSDRITNNSALSIQAEDGALIEYSSNGTTWSTGVPIAGAGLNTVFVRQTDKAGNVSAATQFSFTLDLSAPVEPTIALINDTGLDGADFVTNDGRLSVTTEMGALVEYSTDGVAWSTTQPTAVEGLNSIQVRQTDTAGNVSAAQQITFTLDTLNPAALEVGLNSDTGVNSTDLLTNNASFFINGTEQGALIEYSTDGGTTWSATAPTPVEGSNTFLLRQTDVAGNVSETTTLSFMLDTQANAPTVTLDQDTGLSNTDFITNNLFIRIGDFDGILEFSIDGGMTWSDSRPVFEGLNTVMVRQIDDAGNVSAASTISYVLDRIAPDAPMVELTTDTGLVGDDRISNIGTLSVTGTEDGALIEYSTDNGETWSDTQPTATEGENTVLVRQTDVAGNVSASTSISFTLDTMADAPTVALTDDTGASNSDLITSRTDVTVTGTEDGALIEYSLDGLIWSDMQPKYAQGSNTVYVRQTDVAGNVSASQTLTFTFDTLVDVPVLSLEEDTGASDSDLITRNAQINVANLEAGSTWAYQIDGMGEWIEGSGTSFNAIDGEHSYVVRQTDVAGNIQDSVSFNVNAILEPDAISARMLDSSGNEVENGATSDPNAVLRLSGADTDTWQYRFIAPNNIDTEWQDITGDTDISLIEGAYNVETRKIDVAGNFVSGLNRVSIDTTAATPVMNLVEDTGVDGDGITTNPFVKISGVEGNAIWEVRIDDSTIWNQTTLSTFEYKLLVGTHTYHIRQTDQAGNVSAEGSYTFTYQSAVDQPTVTLADDTGVSNSDVVTSNSTINVGGLLPDATWQYSIDGGEWIDGTDSSFSMLTDGMGHDYAVRQQSAGQWSEPTTIYQVTFDNTAPADFMVALAVDSGASAADGITNNSTLNFSGLEVGTRLQYRIDGGEWLGLDVTSSEQAFDLLVGTHAYDFRSIDIAGNTSSTVSRTYTYINADLAAPTLMLFEDTDKFDDHITSNRQIDVMLSVTGSGITWQYEVDGSGTWINGSGSSFNALAGQHSYRVRQVDVAGNTSPASSPLSVNWDGSAPIFTSGTTARFADPDSEGQQVISSSQVLYTAGANDATAVTYSMAASDVFSFDAVTRQLTFKQPVGYQLGGQNSYSTVINATDAAGNNTARQVTIHVDRTNTATPLIDLGEIKSGLQQNPNSGRSGLTAFGDQSVAMGVSVFNNTSQASYNIPVRYNQDGVEINRFTPPSDTRFVYAFGTDQLDRMYLVTGTGRPVNTLTPGVDYATAIKVLRFDKNGVLDTTYGTDGIVTILPSQAGHVMAISSSNMMNNQLHVANDGRAALTFTQTPDAPMPALFSFESTNSALATISSTGVIQHRNDFNYSSVPSTFENMIALDFGRVGQTYMLRRDAKIQKVVNGVLDTSFGTSGVIDVPATVSAGMMRADDNGKLYVVSFSGSQITLRRYNENGSADTGFGSSGVVTITSPATLSDVAIDIDPVTGRTYIVSNTLNADYVYQVSSAGVRDTSFGGSGAIQMSATGRLSNGVKTAGDTYSVVFKNNKLYIYSEGDGINHGGSSRVVDLIKQAPDDAFGTVLATYNEGSRPVGLLTQRSLVSDLDLVGKNYDGLSITINRQSFQNANDVFGARGDLIFTEQGEMIWKGQEIGSYTNSFGRLSMTFNENTTDQILNQALRSLTYRNLSSSDSGQIKMIWRANDNDSAGAKSSQSIQTINIVNDNADVGDTTLIGRSNNDTIDFGGFFQANGKKYYVAQGSGVSRTKLDSFFNYGEDTSDAARTAVLGSGVQVKLLTQSELEALWASNQVPPQFQKNALESQATAYAANVGRGVATATSGSSTDSHVYYNLKTKTFETVSDTTTSNTSFYVPFVFVEVIESPNPAPSYVDPAIKLLVDNGDSQTDRLTSDGRFEVVGISTSLPYEYSFDAGNTWTLQVAGNTIITAPEGTYAVGGIRVRQTDLSGFTEIIQSQSLYKIDKSIKSLSLVNDQGLSLTDNITADGRVFLTGIDPDLPYEFTLNGGDSWQTGTMLADGRFGFTLPDGVYSVGRIIVRQADINNFVSSARNLSAIQVDGLVGQGQITIVNDNGDNNTDNITSDDRVQVNGLRVNTAFEYSTNAGQTWTMVAASNATRATFSIAEGSYAPNAVLVRQVDETGFTTQLGNRNAFLIDKTVKSLGLLNDQGLHTFDNVSADGRMVVKGLNPNRSYEYTVNGGSTWLSGTKVGSDFIFSLSNGVYNVNQVQVRQTDANNLTTVVKADRTITVSPTIAQGELSMSVDTGSSITDNITSNNRFTVTGLRDSLDWQYSLDNGNTWIAGTRSAGSVQTVILPDGSYAVNQIHVRQVDSAGFTTTIKNSTASVVDTAIASVSVTLLNDTGFSNTDLLTADGRVRFDVTGTLAAGDVWQYSLDGGNSWVLGVGTSQTITVANGSYAAQAIRVKVSDIAGNTSNAQFNSRVVIDNTDTTAPVFTSAPTGFAVDRDGTNATQKVNSTTALMTVQTTDANTVYYSLSGANANLFNINSNGQITFKADTNLSSTAGDRYTLTVNAVDAFNNASSQNVSLTVIPPFELVSRSIGQASDTINADRYVLTFSHEIALDPAGKIKVSNSKGDFFIDASDSSRVQVSGNQLIIFNKGFDAHQTGYRFDLKGIISSKLSQEVWQPPRAEIGFYVDKTVRFENNQLTNNDGVVVQSIDGGNKLGMVTILGDVNGDGIDDWAVSYANADSRGLNDNGKIYVVYGRTDGVTTNLNQVANGQGGYLITGTDNGGLAGSSISAGDVNGDGLRDIAIHVPGANGGMGLGYVVFGRTNASNIDLTFGRGGFAGGRFYSINTSDSFAFVGDVNGDGYDDVAHGRGDINRTTVVENITVRKVNAVRDGEIRVKADWLGFAADWIDTAMKINDFIDDPLTGSIELAAELPELLEEQLGEDGGPLSQVEQAMVDQLAQVIRELRPNQRLVDFSYTQTGGGGGGLFKTPEDTVYRIKYNIETTIKDINRITTTLFGSGETNVQLGGVDGNSGVINVVATEGQQRIGAQVTSLGDINGDGRADFGILDGGQGGQLTQMSVVFGARDNVNVFTGNLQQGIGGFRIRDPQRTGEYVDGGNITGLGDINGDGINDFALTLDSVYAATYVVYGRGGMTGVDLSQVAAGNGGYRLSASSRSSNVHIDAIGDFNGDGLDDYAATVNSAFGQSTSTVYVIYGSRTTPNLPSSLFDITDDTLGLGERGFRVRSSFALTDTDAVSSGDVNGDGLTDLAIRGADGQTIFVMGSTTNGKFSQISADQVGTTGNDTLTSTGTQLIVAGHGNDTINTNGADVVLAGSGNDRVVIDSGLITALYNRSGNGGNTSQLAKIDGGAGRDTLQLSNGLSLDFTRITNKMMDTNNVTGRVDNFEVIDLLTNTASNTLKLTLNDVLEMADSNVFNTNNGWSNQSGSQLSGTVLKHQLVITGANNDVVELRGSEWSNTGATVREQATGEIYNVYQANNGAAAQLLIDRDAQVSWF